MEIHTDPPSPPPYRLIFLAAALALTLAAALYSLTKLPQATADAAATRAQIPNQVTAQATQNALYNQYLTDTYPEKTKTAHTAEKGKRIAIITSLFIFAAVLAGNAVYSINQKHNAAQTTAANLKLHRARTESAALTPGHTPTGVGLTQYTANGVVYTFSQFTGITARADDPRGMEILARHHAPLAAEFLIAAVTAQKEIKIAQANAPATAPKQPARPLTPFLASLPTLTDYLPEK